MTEGLFCLGCNVWSLVKNPVEDHWELTVQVQAAEEAAKQCKGAAAAELEAATSNLKEQIQQLQAAASKGESIAVAAEKEAAETRAQLKSRADQLCSARAEAASYKKEAMSLVDRVTQLGKSSEVITIESHQIRSYIGFYTVGACLYMPA